MRISVANWSTREADADRATDAILGCYAAVRDRRNPLTQGRAAVTAVVLAAGAGSRFGGGKLLAPLEGRPVLQHVLDTLAAAGLASVVVVLGEDAAAMETALHWRTERRVLNPDLRAASPRRCRSAWPPPGRGAASRRTRRSSSWVTSPNSARRRSRRSWAAGDGTTRSSPATSTIAAATRCCCRRACGRWPAV